VTAEQYREACRAEAGRPVDERMLRGLYGGLDVRLVAYGRFVGEVVRQCRDIVRGVTASWDEGAVASHLAAAGAKLPLLSAELAAALEFAAEVRVERGMGLAAVGEVSDTSAAALALRLTHTAERLWDMALGTVEGRARPLPPDATFRQITGGQFPPVKSVLALLHQEHAGARLALRAPAAPLPGTAVDTVVVNAARCEVRTEGPVVPPAPVPPTPQPGPAVKGIVVSKWSELALGVDGQWRVWAVTPVPEVGERFPKARAVELVLPGVRWRALLELAANSPDGRTALREDLARALGYLPDPASLARDPRAKRGADRAGQTAGEGLGERAGRVQSQLRQALSDWRRELRALVGGPADRGNTLLRSDRKTIDTGFVVRFLLSDGTHDRFGGPPTG
jgi:hypothetical protein